MKILLILILTVFLSLLVVAAVMGNSNQQRHLEIARKLREDRERLERQNLEELEALKARR